MDLACLSYESFNVLFIICKTKSLKIVGIVIVAVYRVTDVKNVSALLL
jgi:hypothetical protein